MSAPFSSTLGVRPDVLRLAPASTTADRLWTIRVHGAEVWDAIRCEVLPETRVRDVKVAALAAMMPDVHDADAYVVKVGGVELAYEAGTLTETGVKNGSTLLLMSRRRRAVR